jgi:2-aminoethylphosphonate-pyruvate transaminase
VLILVNGAYGRRQVDMCRLLGIEHVVLEWPDDKAVSVEETLECLRRDAGGSSSPSFTHVSVIHHETTAGVINPLQELATTLKAEFPGVGLLVDSMSAFGAYDLQMDWGIDFAVSSANKCIEGVPGFSFVLCKRDALDKAEGNARSVSFDLHAQWKFMEASGQFRFTPPTHSLLAFRQALDEWEAEGGVAGRAERYRANYEVIRRGMEEMGFKFYVQGSHRSFLIMTFVVPEHRNFQFSVFYDDLANQGFVIYPGKTAQKGESFRFGTIGRVFPTDCELLMSGVAMACRRMDVPVPVK